MKEDEILDELKAMRRQLDSIGGLVHGIYRRSKPGPRQPELPGLVADDSPLPEPGEIARSLPRKWCDTVKVFEALWAVFDDHLFDTTDLFSPKAAAAIAEATQRVHRPQTVSRMVTEFVRAGAAKRPGRGLVRLSEPTDELRERIEEEARKRNAHKAKEVPA